ncbi:DEAD/DEAH box helicase family protein [Microvirga arsenatis]|uniref:DEAD/DEAH box helicase family protein n=1 Tax=Microvirga arsenatis TaxID=2692265 RepID=A0ABW9YTW3_9HYPH|nr:DEAD/DEAH box helicase family protein [Microvirga arsenatis]NBJ09329.1 DEAD/DEAH box helicase family protein [Microvirga arsenatis]NBJ23813.1 DEAD/DEAH box helicase family protein [Microvirga arsenatis]
MELFKFQEAASTQIAERFAEYVSNPLMVDMTKTVPFFQLLVSITGSGKTLILADTCAQIQARLPRQPVVLWLSKGRVVVWQTYNNLSAGKYAENIPGFNVKPLLELAPSDMEDAATPLMLVATVGKFARQDDQEQDRRIFQVQLDLADESLWTLLKRRRTTNGERRPLIVIYDEGQNLSDLQTERLMELAPDALISASATPTVPTALDRIMSRLRTDRSWTDDDFKTTVASAAVVEAGLVKRRISIGGYVTPMETAVDAMLADMREATQAAANIDKPFHPKAIYVCTTNAVDGVPIAEDAKRPFEERQARPILIWRHLVASGIDPSKIAVYAQLKFPGAPPPKIFNLFGAGDRDYDHFVSGSYEHIIFNLALQEGWDDPQCGFAYIDKEMASPRQITQVIGRVLRQPGAQHYADPILNTAHFYIRSDEQGVFEDIIDDVSAQLASEHPAVELSVRPENRRADQYRVPPSKPRAVPTVSIYSKAARDAINGIVSRMMDFRGGGPNVVGAGRRMHVLQDIGVNGRTSYEWIDVEHSNRVSVRSIFRREIQRLFPGGLRRAGGPVNLVDIELPKFDAMVEIASPAAQHVRDVAAQVVDAYIEHSRILQNEDDIPYSVKPIAVDPGKAVTFNNALHPRYSGLNDFELDIARALDRTQRVWCRNPENGGYFIPLLDRGSTGTFWPDFLVWLDRMVVAIDTKGHHLISEDARRKLFDIDSTGDRPRIQVRLITEGRWNIASSGQIGSSGREGYTVWRWVSGRLGTTHVPDTKTAVETALTL